jgi:5-methylcytosine-specific restriction endonuclease McrA
MLHVLVGENDVKSGFEETAKAGGQGRWIVPKSAQPADPVFFVFNWDLLSASGRVASQPRPVAFGRQTAFQATVGELQLFNRPIPLSELEGLIPEWKWLSYPRTRTTPPIDVARKLDRIVANHLARSGLRNIGGKPDDETKAGNRNGSGSKRAGSTNQKDVKLSGAQLDAIIRDQTGAIALGEEGRKYLRTHVETERKSANRKYILELRAQRGPLLCDACGTDMAHRYGPEHREVLELHHVVPLARGVQRPRGTDAFALLCPSCHRVVHYRREDPLDVSALRQGCGRSRRRPTDRPASSEGDPLEQGRTRDE